MTPDQVFAIANPFALAGWLILAWAVIKPSDWLRDQVAGTWWPLALSALYTLLVVFFFFSAPGGFDSLSNVQTLFTSDWVALAGWVHYLAFDLFIGARIARELMALGLPRLLLVALLPLTFLFGPAGFLAWQISRVAFSKPVTA